ncbi:MAG: single-stranded DNA-binding protein [Deltaproteobacteria bacterium]|jgi:single-strand DNA-binding protein|nr:single-stranded DNA-binding protein [Deltaproteobacteria bacterium]
MSGVNKAILLGRLGRDPELKFTSTGKSVCTFTLATSERWGDGERTEWHRIVMYDRMSETANQYLRKGDQVYLEGRIQTRSWNDKSGGKHTQTEIVAGFMQMLGSPKSHRPADAAPRSPSEAQDPAYLRNADNPFGPDGAAGSLPPGPGTAEQQAQTPGRHQTQGTSAGGPYAPAQYPGPSPGGRPSGGPRNIEPDDDPLPTDDDMPF